MVKPLLWRQTMNYMLTSAVLTALFAGTVYQFYGLDALIRYNFVTCILIVTGVALWGLSLVPAKVCHTLHRLHIPAPCAHRR